MAMIRKVLWAILSHQEPIQIHNMLGYWRQKVGDEILLLYGGKQCDFESIEWANKMFIEDPWLLTKDHPRELQSYRGVFEKAKEFIEMNEGYSHVFFTEYDQIPLSVDLENRLLRQLDQKNADVLFSGLQRVDGTSHPHWLFELGRGVMISFLQKVSTRPRDSRVYSCYGFGQFWKVEAFTAVAELTKSPRVYLELWIPTAAYHLGFQLGKIDCSECANKPNGELGTNLNKFISRGEMLAHPAKMFWEE